MGLNWAGTIFGGAERVIIILHKTILNNYFSHIVNYLELDVH